MCYQIPHLNEHIMARHQCNVDQIVLQSSQNYSNKYTTLKCQHFTYCLIIQTFFPKVIASYQYIHKTLCYNNQSIIQYLNKSNIFLWFYSLTIHLLTQYIIQLFVTGRRLTDCLNGGKSLLTISYFCTEEKRILQSDNLISLTRIIFYQHSYNFWSF